MLPFQARVNLGAMSMKGCSAFPKAPGSLEPHQQIVQCHIQDTHCGGRVLPLCRGAVSVFYSPSRLGNTNKRFSSRFSEDSQVQHKTPEEGQKTYQSKCVEYNNKDDINSLNTLNNNNHQISSQKFRPLIILFNINHLLADSQMVSNLLNSA